MHKKDMGSFGEALVVSQVIAENCSAFIEFGDNSKVDLIVLDGLYRAHRVQIKTVGREAREPDVSKLYLYKSGPNYAFAYDASMFDWFAVVDIITKKIAWVPISVLETHKTLLTLRHTPTKNGQSSGVEFFDDYLTFPFVPKRKSEI